MGVQVLLATGRWDDFASLLVPRKPGGGGCVCMAYRNSSLDLPGRIAHMQALCASEPGPGVLAYVDGKAAGWCSAAPKSTSDLRNVAWPRCHQSCPSERVNPTRRPTRPDSHAPPTA